MIPICAVDYREAATTTGLNIDTNKYRCRRFHADASGVKHFPQWKVVGFTFTHNNQTIHTNKSGYHVDSNILAESD